MSNLSNPNDLTASPARQQVAASVERQRTAWQYFLDRTLSTPSVQGHVTDAVTGDPGGAGYLPLNAVRWLTPSRDLAALVTETGPDRFAADPLRRTVPLWHPQRVRLLPAGG